jgi:hypothetical protein
MKIRLSYLAPVSLAKRIKTCFQKTGLEWAETNCYGEVWKGPQEQVLLCAKKLNAIAKAQLYTEVIR